VVAVEQDKLVEQALPGKVTLVEQDEFNPEIQVVVVVVVQAQQVQVPYHLKAAMVA
jgi:hypothetical protein